MREKFIIAAPSEKKARIIMNHVNNHVFDNPMFYSQLDVESAKERLKKETSKKRVTFKHGGEISILSLDARNSKRNVEAAMGHGAANVILDESSLIDDVLYSTVKRMLGGHKKNFLLEIGNPFYRNHFYRTGMFDENYYKIFIDYKQALEEGRFTPQFIEEMRKEPLFDIFYECRFPDEDAIDADGYRQLIPTQAINFVDSLAPHEGELKFGMDVGGGGDSNVGILRSNRTAQVITENRSNDTMSNVSEIERVLELYKEKKVKEGEKKPPFLRQGSVSVDDIGIGRGVSDRCKEKKIYVNSVSVGSPADDKTKFANKKAELCWRMREWILAGGQIRHPRLREQLTWYKYKVTTDKVIQMEPKDHLKQRTGKSPDYGDALMLTFENNYQPTIRFV